MPDIGLTRREKIFLICAVLLGIFSSVISDDLRVAIEIPILCFIGVPMVILLITDPDRKLKGE